MTPQNDTRQRLIEAARDLFMTQGYNATGVAQILRQAGVNSGSLYYFFPTKEDLLLAVLEWYRDNIWDDLLRPVFERIDDPIERIFGVLDGYRQLLTMFEFELGCPIGSLTIEIANSHPGTRPLLITNFENWIEAIERCLAEAEGRLPEGLERRKLAVHILCTMEGAVMLGRTYRSLEPFDDAIEQLRDYFERLLSDGTEWSRPRSSAPEKMTRSRR
jgi:AcrR family transcriptional regulator